MCVGGDVPVSVSKVLYGDKIPLSFSVGLMEKIKSCNETSGDGDIVLSSSVCVSCGMLVC